MTMASQLLNRLIPDDPDDAPSHPAAPAPLRRLRLLLVTLCLALLVFAQNAGTTAADTKFDLVVSPWRFLHRSLQLWDPIGGAGQLQNQAYGYLFPMGPFFGILHTLTVPPWEIQRAWQTALVVAAFLGVYRLSKHFGCTGFWPRVAAGLVYALAPRMISELSAISSELMPVAALPWIMLPLVTGARMGRPRRQAARSGVALLFAGGVNAAAALAVLPVPALWLLTRTRGPRRGALIRWWLLAVLLACLWWLLPLLVLGSYSPPFLNWIEAASTTTLPTSLSAVIRGVDHWESYLGPSVWPGAWILASAPAAIVATMAVAGLGLAGLARRTQPHRSFLWLTLLLGLVLVTLGHQATVGPPFALQFQSLLNGPLAAFRNVHKFDPLIRLPLALGFGAALQNLALPRWWRTRLLVIPARAVAIVAICAAGAVAISPTLTNQSVASPRVTTEPGWWTSTGQWLGEHAGGGRALLVPASASPFYLWGGTVDTALQPVASTPWTVRDAVPLAQAGYIRLLDSITSILAEGRPDPALAALLNRSGIGYLVLANDLNAYRSGATAQMLLHASIDGAPGFSLAASFGPEVGAGASSDNKLVDGGASTPRPSVQIYRVQSSTTAGSSPLVALQPLSGAIAANGSSDQLPALVARGLTADRPVLFGSDAAAAGLPADQAVLTDGIRRQQASFGNAFSKSGTLTATDPFTGSRAAYDYLPDDTGPLSVFRYGGGLADVTASSSGSDVTAYFNRSAANVPFAALDGDPATAWRSGSPSGSVGQWLQLTFDHPVTARQIGISFTGVGPTAPSQVVVRTDSGSLAQSVLPTAAAQLLRLPTGSTRTLRITVAAVAGGGFGSTVGISLLSVPGVNPLRSLVIPATANAPGQLLFTAAPGNRGSCLTWQGRADCDPSYPVAAEEDSGIDRSITLGAGGDYLFSTGMVLQPSATLLSALSADAGVRVSASSTLPGDPRVLASSLIDDDPTTSWQAARGDTKPLLSMTLPEPRVLTGVRVGTDRLAAAAVPLTVSVTAGTQHWQGKLPADGQVRFHRPVLASKLSIRIIESSLRSSTSSVNVQTSLLPVGISELQLDSATALSAPDQIVYLPCSAGLSLTVDGRRIPLSVTAARADVLASRPVAAVPCVRQPVPLAAGQHTIALAASPLARPATISAQATTLPPAAELTATGLGTETATVQRWGSTSREVAVHSPGRSVLVIRENANKGWQAKLNGRSLKAVRADGWQQGFLVPAGATGIVHLSFAPQRSFVLGLWLGGFAVLLLLLLAMLRPRGSRRLADASAPLAEAELPWWLALFAIAVAAVLLTGLWGLGVVLGVVLLCELVVSTGRSVPPWLVLPVAVLPALMQSQSNVFTLFSVANSSLSQLLCVAAVVLGALGPRWRLGPRQGTEA
jgi:arabinofuranan 3-O-arabinosyltransferase